MRLNNFFLIEVYVGNENSAQSLSDRSFFEPPWGHGCLLLRVMDGRTKMLLFPRFRGPHRSFCPRTSAGISAWTSTGSPVPKLTLWAACPFLITPVAFSSLVLEDLHSPHRGFTLRDTSMRALWSGVQNCYQKVSLSFNHISLFSQKYVCVCELQGVLQGVAFTGVQVLIGRTPKGTYSPRGRSRCLLETPFSEPLLRTLLRTISYCKTHSRPPSQNPSENPSPEPFPEPSQNPS